MCLDYSDTGGERNLFYSSTAKAVVAHRMWQYGEKEASEIKSCIIQN